MWRSIGNLDKVDFSKILSTHGVHSLSCGLLLTVKTTLLPWNKLNSYTVRPMGGATYIGRVQCREMPPYQVKEGQSTP